MKKLFQQELLTLISLLTFALPSVASEIPKELEGVMNLQHPGSTLYVAGQPKPEDFAAFAKMGVVHVALVHTWTPTFAKLLFHDFEKVKIAAIHPDFV